jgi:hypothetical protein
VRIDLFRSLVCYSRPVWTAAKNFAQRALALTLGQAAIKSVSDLFPSEFKTTKYNYESDPIEALIADI